MANQNKAYQYETLARKADQSQDWREAEKYYLLAAQELASSNLAEDSRNRKKWDLAAKRARRLQQVAGKAES